MMDEGHTFDVITSICQFLWLRQQRIFLAKMMPFGLSDVVVQWIEAYLSGWVHNGGEPSGTFPMRSGVPLGSVKGPLLFLLFVNNLPGALEALAMLFSDDVKKVTRRTQKVIRMELVAEMGSTNQSW